jgi:3-phosphoglycerate kinase
VDCKTLEDIELSGKSVLMRVDFNIPLSKDGDILDDTRIKAALPSINYIMEKGGSVVLMSHLGRPGGRKDPSMSLKIAAYRLGELTESPVKFVGDCV